MNVPRSSWLVSPRSDVWCVMAGTLAAALLWAIGASGLCSVVTLYVVFQLALNMPHNFQTWSMSLLDRDDRRANGRYYLVATLIALAVFALPMLFSPDRVYPWVGDALLYWGYYHQVRQHQGIELLLERRAGDVSARESWWWARYLEAVAYLPLLLRFLRPDRMVLHVGARSIPVHFLPMPAIAEPLLLAILCGAVIAAGWFLFTAWRAGRAVLPRALHLAAVTGWLVVSNLAIDDLIVATIFMTATHDVQYLVLVAFHNRTRLERREYAGNAVLRWFSEKRGWRHVLLTFAFGVVLIAPRAFFRESVWSELPLTMAIAFHYLADARVWSLRRNPQRKAWLGFARPSPAPAIVQAA